MNHTIAAICTPPGQGAIATIRLSGPQALAIAARATRMPEIESDKANTARLHTIYDADGKPIDSTVITLFRAPHSFTGEDTAEISCHGSIYIQQTLLDRFIALGARPAQHGEFSKRAFLNGKIDLAQAEGIADLIAAQSKIAHQLAQSQISGRYSARINDLTDRLIHLASMLELELDFSEEDVEFASRDELLRIAQHTLTQIEELTASYRAGNAFRSGIPIAIAGIPNAGKSTILNALTGHDSAIVTHIPGTTRDTIEETIQIDGFPFRLIDTAGLRNTNDPIEKIGISKARKTIENAIAILWIIDLNAPLKPQLKLMHDSTERSGGHIIIVPNKADISSLSLPPELEALPPLSAATDEGIAEIRRALCREAEALRSLGSDITVTNARHYDALARALDPARRIIDEIEQGQTADIIAQTAREIIHELGAITGRITTDAILTNIFSSFCIGK